MRSAIHVSLFSVLALVLLGLGGGPVRGDEDPYPVWWSPVLGLESLDAIDRRLEQDTQPRHRGFRIDVPRGSHWRLRTAYSCADIRRLEREAAGPLDSPDIYVGLMLYRECLPIERLRDARPSTTSYVSDFSLDARALDYLPAMLNLAPSCDWMCRLYAANERGIPWSRFAEGTIAGVDVTSWHDMTVETDLDLVHVEILARADFDSDGREELFVRATTIGKEGRWGDDALFMLTRDRPDGVLSVEGAETYICPPDYYHRCDMYFDVPPALRKPE